MREASQHQLLRLCGGTAAKSCAPAGRSGAVRSGLPTSWLGPPVCSAGTEEAGSSRKAVGLPREHVAHGGQSAPAPIPSMLPPGGMENIVSRTSRTQQCPSPPPARGYTAGFLGPFLHILSLPALFSTGESTPGPHTLAHPCHLGVISESTRGGSAGDPGWNFMLSKNILALTKFSFSRVTNIVYGHRRNLGN